MPEYSRPKEECSHNSRFESEVHVDTRKSHYQVTLKLTCADCGAPLVFQHENQYREDIQLTAVPVRHFLNLCNIQSPNEEPQTEQITDPYLGTR